MTMRCVAAIACVVLAGLVPAGCATATMEDAVPASALEEAPPAADAPAPPAAPEQGAGTYPNLNVTPAVAAPQISAEQKAAETAGLRARREQLAAQAGQRGVSDDAEALRRLAGSHGEETLKEIEGD